MKLRALVAACLLLPIVAAADAPPSLTITALPDPGPKLDALGAKLDAILAQLKAGSTLTVVAGPPGQAAPAAGTAPVAAADAFFPPVAADAQFPSPENSRQLREAGKVTGKPYLLDTSGMKVTLVDAPDLVAGAEGSAGLMINGRLFTSSYGPTTMFDAAIVRQGKVYVQQRGGQWQLFNPSMGSLYNAALPDAWAGGSAPATTTPAATAAAALPAPYAIAPGSSGRVLKAAPGQIAAVLATARDGDTLELDGKYAEKVPGINVALLVRLAPGTVVDFEGQDLAYGKGGFVPGMDFVLEGPAMDKAPATVRGAGNRDTEAQGTGCIRPGATSYVTVRGNLLLTRCQNAIAGGGFPWVLDVADVTLDDNGIGDGRTHNLYASEGAARVTLTRVTSRNARGGHAIKARTAMFSMVDCDISGAETLIDLPNGTATLATVRNTKLAKTPGAENHRVIGYGEEGASIGTAGMLITGGSLSGGDAPFIHGVGTVTFDGTAILGTTPVGNGVTVKGF